jgi:hypothetical protein
VKSMARLILLYVKDNDAAEEIVKQSLHLAEAERISGHEMAEFGTLVASYSTVEWMIARPLVWCRCLKAGKNHQWGWAKTKRFGWWVHSECNRSSRMVVEKYVTNLLNGHNDLLPELRAKLLADQQPVEEKVES